MKKNIIFIFILSVFIGGCSSSGELQKSPCACNDKNQKVKTV